MHLNIHPEHYNSNPEKTLENAFEYNPGNEKTIVNALTDKLGKQYTYEIDVAEKLLTIIRPKLDPLYLKLENFNIEPVDLPITLELNRLGGNNYTQQETTEEKSGEEAQEEILEENTSDYKNKFIEFE